jgi:hypothetical protein
MLVLGHGNVEKAELFPHFHNPYFYFFGVNSLKNLPYNDGTKQRRDRQKHLN